MYNFPINTQEDEEFGNSKNIDLQKLTSKLRLPLQNITSTASEDTNQKDKSPTVKDVKDIILQSSKNILGTTFLLNLRLQYYTCRSYLFFYTL